MPKDDPLERTLAAMEQTTAVVDGYVRAYCSSRFSSEPTLYPLIVRCLADVGMQLRAFLLRASYESDGHPFEQVIPVCAGIELIQISTLVLDDILDESPVRNALPSIMGEWGANSALAVGTVVSSAGFVLLAESLARGSWDHPAEVLSLLLETHRDIYVGQFLDICYAGNPSTHESDYLRMISLTTASFVCAPLVAGALLRGVPAEVIALLRGIGTDIGMALQLRDDVIDIIGEPEFTGKAIADDIRTRKMRLPLIYALSMTEQSERLPILHFLTTHEVATEPEIRTIVNLMFSTGAIEYAVRVTQHYCQRVLDAADALSRDYSTLSDRLCAIAHLIGSFGEPWQGMPDPDRQKV